MKANVHPQWFKDASVTCSCGNTFTVGSTREEIRTEICGRCHPFFTGESRYVDTMGRVERFQKSVTIASDVKRVKKKKKEAEERSDKQPKTLREMLLSLQKQ